MPTFEAQRLDTRQSSSSRERPSPSPVRDWSPYLRPSAFDSEGWDTDEQDRVPSPGQNVSRNSGQRPLFGDGTWRTFEEHERWEAERRRTHALQPRNQHYRARSADQRRSTYQKNGTGRVLTPEPSVRFNHRPNSDPQPPRFEELPADLDRTDLDESGIYETHSDHDDYEAPARLLGQAQDCLESLSRAAQKARTFGEREDKEVSDIADRCEDSLFRLKVWIEEAKLGTVPTAGENELDDKVMTLASSILFRLHIRATALARHIDRTAMLSSAQSFSFAGPAQQDIDDDGSDREHSSLPQLTPAARVQQDLKQVALQIRNLRRLSRSLRVVQKDEFSTTVMKHVAEVTQLFGTEQDCERWRDEAKGKPADAALKSVKDMVGICV